MASILQQKLTLCVDRTVRPHPSKSCYSWLGRQLVVNILVSVRLFALSILVLWVVSQPQARAQLNGLEELGHSYQADARGGTEVAVGDTGLAQIRQPASLGLHKRGRFDSKLTFIYPRNRWNGPAGGDNSSVSCMRSYNLGYVRPLTEKFSAGIAFEKGGWSSSFNSPYLLYNPGQNTKASLDYTHYSSYVNFGYKANEKLLLGAGPRVEVLSFKTDFVMGPGKLTWPKSWAVGSGFEVGALYLINPKWQTGVSYRSPLWCGGMHTNNATFEIPGQGTQTGRLGISNFTLPQRLSFGLSYKPTKKLRLITEGGWIGNSSSVFGHANVTGLANLPFSPGYRDVWLCNNGFDYDFNENWSCSGGFSFNNQPIVKQAVTPVFPSNCKQMFTYGLRYKRGRMWTGVTHIIGLPSVSTSNGNTNVPLGLDYQFGNTRQMLQSVNCGVGFYF